MTYFTQEFQRFMRGLAANNNREWFNSHRQDYEESVRQPFLDLVTDLLPLARKLEPAISPRAADAIFRIHRDLRFSQDKSPYHTVLKASFAPGGRKAIAPAFYLGVGADGLHLGGGLYRLDGAGLRTIRRYILRRAEVLDRLLRSEVFADTFGELEGESVRRLPKEFQSADRHQELLMRKQFYAMAHYPDETRLCDEDLRQFIEEHWRAVAPLNDFLRRALESEQV